MLALPILVALLSCGGGGGAGSSVIAPSITTQPISQTVLEGDPATFFVAASGTSPSYQWSKGAAALDSATSTRFTIPVTAVSDSASVFTVKVSNSAGSAISNAATLTVHPKASITTFTATPATITQGSSATLHSAFTQGTGAGSSGTIDNGVGTISSGTAPTVSPSATTTYTLRVDNGYGDSVTKSATVTVVPAPVATITVLSTVTTGAIGLTASVPAQSGSTYAWTATGATISTGQGTSQITLTAGAVGTAKVSCIVTNTAGTSLSSTSDVAVVAAPTASLAASDTNPDYGATVTLTPTFIGTNAVIDHAIASSALSGTAYTTPAISSAITYTLTVTNAAGDSATDSRTITPKAISVAAISPANPYITVNGTQTFTCLVGNAANTSLRWRSTGGSITDDGGYTAPAIAGDYTITAAPVADPTRAVTTTVHVVTVPDATIAAPSQVYFGSTQNTASVAVQPGCRYAWSLTGDGAITGSAASQEVTFSANASGSSLTLSCAVTNAAGTTDTKNATLNLVAAPAVSVFTANPATILSGDPVTLHFLFVGGTATITPGELTVTSGTDVIVNPTTTTTYTLTLTPGTGSPITQTATVNVGASIAGTIFLTSSDNGSGGEGAAGVALTLYKQSDHSVAATATTANDGTYTFPAVPNDTYTLEPSLGTGGASAIFAPSFLNLTLGGTNLSGQNFGAYIGFQLSGAISYSGSRTGRIYIKAQRQDEVDDGAYSYNGVSIPQGASSYTIRGVRPGTYNLEAWMDTAGTSVGNVTSPIGSTTVTVGWDNASAPTITLSDPASSSLNGVAGPAINLFANDQGAVISWGRLNDAQGIEEAVTYELQRDTVATFDSADRSTALIQASGAKDYMQWQQAGLVGGSYDGGLSNGTPYYFRLRGVGSDASTTDWSPVQTITPNASSGRTVSGTITFPGTATGPLIVALYAASDGHPFLVKYGSAATPPTSPVTYSVSGLPDGDYKLRVLLDQDANDYFSAGDLNNLNDPDAAGFTLAADIIAKDLILVDQSHFSSIRTRHDQTSTSYENFDINVAVKPGVHTPVNVSLQCGTSFFDIGTSRTAAFSTEVSRFTGDLERNLKIDFGNFRPSIVSTYQTVAEYPDGVTTTTESLIAPMMGILDPPTGLSPSGSGSGITAPTFTWLAPSTAPGMFTFSFYIYNQTGIAYYFEHEKIPSGTPSQTLPEALNVGETYQWAAGIDDSFENHAYYWQTYTP